MSILEEATSLLHLDHVLSPRRAFEVGHDCDGRKRSRDSQSRVSAECRASAKLS